METSSSLTNVSFKVYDVLGQVLYQEDIPNISKKYSKEFDISKFVEGIYYLQMRTNEGTVNRKILINK